MTAGLLAALLLSSCIGLGRHLQDDEKVLRRNRYDIAMTDGSQAPKEVEEALDDMKKYVRQKPNSRILGVGPRVSMRVYCLSNPEKDNFWQRYLRRKWQAPVVYDEGAAEQTTQQLKGLLQSKGCFGSEVTYDTIWNKKHEVDVTYHIRATPRYMIDHMSFKAETDEVDRLLKQRREESLLKEGDYYDQELMDKERSRLAERLRNDGYYYANSELVSYVVDTAFGDYTLSLRLNLRNPRIVMADRTSETQPLQKYRMDEIYIYPNASATSANSTPTFDTLIDTTVFRERSTAYHFLYNQPMTLKPRTIDKALFLFNGQTYRPRNSSRTYSSLQSLRNFKYINIEYSESPNSSDTNRLLNAKVRLINAKRQRLSTSIEINNSSPFGTDNEEGGIMSGNFGLEAKLNYQNKNLFGGAELFNTELSLLVELPKLFFKDNEENLRDQLSNFESGLNLSLELPTFLFPFTRNILWQRMRPHTLINAGANYQLHSYFERLLFNVGFGYNWSRNQHSHQLLPLELTYVRFYNIDSAFRSRMERISDARLKYQYSDHFIMDARYDYIYNTQRYGQRNDFNYYHFSIESAGNLLAALSRLADGPQDENGIRQIFDVPFSQYVRFNAEYKHYTYIGERSTLVSRLMVGIGLPYGNSSAMPYEKSFFGGGPTTLRAWHLRYLGPGLFAADSVGSLERIGDLQLVANLEYRFPIISIFEGALFTDVGNVWLTHKSEEFPGGQFTLSDFPKSIAVGVGAGLRANISIVTLRLDLAIPLYDPGYEQSQRWRPPHWKTSQITANFGIDYPF